MSSAPKLSPGVRKYVDAAKKLLAQRDSSLARMKAMKFDTLAVHGLYTVEEALERNQGAGAGKVETGFAILSDILAIHRC